MLSRLLWMPDMTAAPPPAGAGGAGAGGGAQHEQQRRRQQQQQPPPRPPPRGGGRVAAEPGFARHLDREREKVPGLGGAPAEVKRVCRSGNFYEVLQLERDAGDSEVREARKRLVLLVHPDKNHAHRDAANKAFQLVDRAVQELSDPSKRAEYSLKVFGRQGFTGGGAGMGGGASSSAARGGAAGGGAGGAQRAPGGAAGGAPRGPQRTPGGAAGGAGRGGQPPPPFDPDWVEMQYRAARYCAEHNTYHAVKKGDFWVEQDEGGFFNPGAVHAYCAGNGAVYDATEAAECLGFNECLNPYWKAKIKLGRAGGGEEGGDGGGGGGGGRGGGRGARRRANAQRRR
ncbi:MAG: hypothetical protein J3K34DRAFT_507829 [Monoraphidium minutum]|nr:MAG: hypothetical protein J3K34DRAFT_507829 [Monoraphidium minutum]